MFTLKICRKTAQHRGGDEESQRLRGHKREPEAAHSKKSGKEGRQRQGQQKGAQRGDQKTALRHLRRAEESGGHHIKSAEEKAREVDAQPLLRVGGQQPVAGLVEKRGDLPRPHEDRAIGQRGGPQRKEGSVAQERAAARQVAHAAAAADERLHPLRDTDEDRKLDEREIRHDAVGGDAGITGHRQDNKVEGGQRGGGRQLRHH